AVVLAGMHTAVAFLLDQGDCRCRMPALHLQTDGDADDATADHQKIRCAGGGHKDSAERAHAAVSCRTAVAAPTTGAPHSRAVPPQFGFHSPPACSRRSILPSTPTAGKGSARGVMSTRHHS